MGRMTGTQLAISASRHSGERAKTDRFLKVTGIIVLCSVRKGDADIATYHVRLHPPQMLIGRMM
jgi:hypothetical protein